MFTIDCTGDVVKGDTIQFKEAVWGGYRPSAGWRHTSKKGQPLGERVVVAEVVNDSYGRSKGQHTFTLRVLESSGYDPLEPSSVIVRKGRNVYRKGTMRVPWEDEEARHVAAEEKHERGEEARRGNRPYM